jgi:hypothetical protein
MDGDRMPMTAQRGLQKALSSVNVCSQPRESAWVLRHALDNAYDVMMPLQSAR